MANATPAAKARSQRRTLIGVVTRDKTDKTRRVDVERLVKHARYGKFIKKRTVCYVHDEKNESHAGDTVEIMETRPLSKQKCWRLIRVVTKAPAKVQLVEAPTA
jgi:small subunit ribosomal protein S17